MFFTRTQSFLSTLSQEDITNRLTGKHVKIHNLDFEVYEKDNRLSIVPHAEQEEGIKTLPITNLTFSETGGKTKITATSKMRAIDSGGPFLIVIFCAFMFIASMIFLKMEPIVSYTLLGVSVFIFTLFCIRLQMGYFDYVRKVRNYVKSKVATEYTEAEAPFAHA